MKPQSPRRDIRRRIQKNMDLLIDRIHGVTNDANSINYTRMK